MKKTPAGNDSESTVLGWKFIAIVGTLTAIFFTFLYLALSNEPDYMPNRKPKVITEQIAATEAAPPTEKSNTASDNKTTE